ncbi:MAG: hypothetical protein GF308_12670 [Candidatus Heimdallarchaeota archaeon]|nr:hypothetical protein [Candidatus Heimdallarchaeota archaeon]
MVSTDLILSALIAGFFFLLFALMLYQSITHNRKAYVLTISLLIGGIGGIVSVLHEFISLKKSYFLFYSIIIWSVCYFLIYLFFEELTESKPNRVRLSIGLLLLFASIFFNQLFFYAPSIGSSALPATFKTSYETFIKILEWSWDISYSAFGVFVFSFGAYVHIKSYQSNKENIPLVQAISMILISLGFIIGFFGADVANERIFYAIGDGLKVVGMIVFSLIYIIKIDFIYRLPVNVYFIMVFNKVGLNILTVRTYNIKNQENEGISRTIINENLLSSLITAISNLLRESLGSEKPLEMIIAEDRTIVLDSGSQATCAILCDRPTFFLEKSLKNLRKEVEKRYETELRKSVLLKEEFEEINKLIQRSFPFLVIKESMG